MNTTVVQGLENQLEDTKGLIKRRDLALKLSANTEFRKLILEDFCTKDCARLVHESADPALSLESRADALAMAQAGGHLKRYLSAAFQMGQNAENSLNDLEEALAEARGEEEEDAAEAAREARERDARSINGAAETHGDLA